MVGSIEERLDRAARSYGPEQYTSLGLLDRACQIPPKKKVSAKAYDAWLELSLVGNKLEVIGRGTKDALVFKNKGEWAKEPIVITSPTLAPVTKKRKVAEKGISRDAIRAIIREKFGTNSFSIAELMPLLKSQYPSKTTAQVRMSLSPWVTDAVRRQELAVVTSEKTRFRRYRLVGDKAAIVETPVVVETPIVETPTVDAKPSVVAPTNPSAVLVEAMCGWLDSVVADTMKSVQEVLTKRVVEFETLLLEARSASLEQIASSMPQYPKLFALVQEIKGKEVANGQAKSDLPFYLSTYHLRYEKDFEDTYEKLSFRDKEVVRKSIHLLACNGANHPSLATKRLEEGMKGKLKGSFVSRAGDYRFAWLREGNMYNYIGLFRRGDLPSCYGSEA